MHVIIIPQLHKNYFIVIKHRGWKVPRESSLGKHRQRLVLLYTHLLDKYILFLSFNAPVDILLNCNKFQQ